MPSNFGIRFDLIANKLQKFLALNKLVTRILSAVSTLKSFLK